jgi:hypothetical protein
MQTVLCCRVAFVPSVDRLSLLPVECCLSCSQVHVLFFFITKARILSEGSPFCMHSGRTDSKHIKFSVQLFSHSSYSTDVPCHSPEDVRGWLNSRVSRPQSKFRSSHLAQHLTNELALSSHVTG